ncbi:hypothetical protein D1AOALGA4SA_10197 [Olavius algarvensis Delta 1 endosymbiont]|nr:hypothetical protein D1AOALGA4SA_10197 [Olavius algarvensis Delta 1 endosymbiont]
MVEFIFQNIDGFIPVLTRTAKGFFVPGGLLSCFQYRRLNTFRACA